LHATADIFVTLKANQDEPDLDRAMRVGVPTEDGLIEGDLRCEFPHLDTIIGFAAFIEDFKRPCNLQGTGI